VLVFEVLRTNYHTYQTRSKWTGLICISNKHDTYVKRLQCNINKYFQGC